MFSDPVEMSHERPVEWQAVQGKLSKAILSTGSHGPREVAMRLMILILFGLLGGLWTLPASVRAADLPATATTSEVERALTPFVRLLGTVVEEETDDPIEGARIRFGDHSLYSEDGGLFDIEPLLLGRYYLEVEKQGYLPERRVVVAAPPLTTIKVVLRRRLEHCPWPGLTQSAALPLPADRELILPPAVLPPAPEVKMETPGSKPVRVPRAGISAGTALADESRDSSWDRSGWEAEPEPSRRPRLDTSRGFAPLSGRVTEAGSGRPLAGVMVEVGPRMVTSGSDGRYRMEEVPCQRFRVVFSRKGYHSRQKSVSIGPEGAVLHATLRSLTPPADASAQLVPDPVAVEETPPLPQREVEVAADTHSASVTLPTPVRQDPLASADLAVSSADTREVLASPSMQGREAGSVPVEWPGPVPAGETTENILSAPVPEDPRL